jgi:hypothetical protein
MTNHINNKNRKMFFENIMYILFINVILMFVTRFKKQNFVWNMYKKTLINKLINVMICDIKKKHDLFFFKYLTWSQSWVSNMSNNSTRFNSWVEQKFLFNSRVWTKFFVQIREICMWRTSFLRVRVV